MAKRKAKLEFVEWAKINRRNAKCDRAIAKFLDNAEIILSESAPRDRESLIELYRADQRALVRNSGVVAFFRHNLTNYDDILDEISKRWQGHLTPWDAKERLKYRAGTLCIQYLRSIGAEDLKQPSPFKRG